MHFFSSDSQFAKSNQVVPLFLFVFIFIRPLNSSLFWHEPFDLNFFFFFGGTFSGGFKEHINSFCKVKPRCKICSRDEWDIGSPILCVQKWSWWGKCSEYMIFSCNLSSLHYIMYNAICIIKPLSCSCPFYPPNPCSTNSTYSCLVYSFICLV